MSEEQDQESILDEAKGAMDSFNSLKTGYDAVKTVMSAGTFSNILRLITLLFLGVGFFLVKAYINKLKRKYAERLTQSNRDKLEAYVKSLEQTNADDDFNDEDKL